MDQLVAQLALTLERGRGDYALLLGSGVSASAGVKTGDGVVTVLLADLLGRQGTPDELKSWFEAYYKKLATYSSVLEQIAHRPADQSNVLRPFFENKEPTPAHRAIAWLVKHSFIQVIVTTNFDRLLERALHDEGIEHVVIHHFATVGEAPPLRHRRVLVVKPHGDYLHLNLKNTEAALAGYEPELEAYLRQIFTEYGLIASGWSGNSDPALRDILKTTTPKFASYWLSYSTPSDVASEVIAARNARVATGVSADAFFGQLKKQLSARMAPSGVSEASLKKTVPTSTGVPAKADPLTLAKELREIMHRTEPERPYEERDKRTVPPWGLYSEDYQWALEFFEAKTKPLALRLAELVRTADEATARRMVTRVLKVLELEPHAPGNATFTPVGEQLRGYPLVLCVVAAVMSAYDEEKYDFIGHVLRLPYTTYVNGLKTNSSILKPFGLLHWWQAKEVFGQVEHKRVACTAFRIQKVMRAWLESQLVGFAETFHHTEFVLSLAVTEHFTRDSSKDQHYWATLLPGVYNYDAEGARLVERLLEHDVERLEMMFKDPYKLMARHDQLVPHALPSLGRKFSAQALETVNENRSAAKAISVPSPFDDLEV